MSLRDRLIDDWHRSWRLASVQVNAGLALFCALYALVPAIPAEIAAIVPDRWRAPLLAAWAAVGILARLYRQKHPNG
ncbi:MAG: hypothetical protein ACM3ZV_07355 [Bacillota bacterium]